MRILFVEDDPMIAAGLIYSLEQEGYAVTHCTDVRSGLEAAAGVAFDLVLLDLTLPDGSGLEVFRAIREQADTPLIILTAMDEEVNVVMGLDMGADDYITKPFRLRELLARIKTVMRRGGKADVSGESPDLLRLADITIDPVRARVYKGGEEVLLTSLEYRLLLIFAGSPGQVFSRSQLLSGLWDAAGDYVTDNTLTVYIKRLREKIEDDSQSPGIIQTVRGLGYKGVAHAEK